MKFLTPFFSHESVKEGGFILLIVLLTPEIFSLIVISR